VNIPENLRGRHEDLDCWLHSRDNEPPARLTFTAEKVLIERITRAEDQVETLTEQVRVLRLPVSDEEWMVATGCTAVFENELMTREAADDLVAARSPAGKEGEDVK
jgi:hypothetical protein